MIHLKFYFILVESICNGLTCFVAKYSWPSSSHSPMHFYFGTSLAMYFFPNSTNSLSHPGTQSIKIESTIMTRVPCNRCRFNDSMVCYRESVSIDHPGCIRFPEHLFLHVLDFSWPCLHTSLFVKPEEKESKWHNYLAEMERIVNVIDWNISLSSRMYNVHMTYFPSSYRIQLKS